MSTTLHHTCFRTILETRLVINDYLDLDPELAELDTFANENDLFLFEALTLTPNDNDDENNVDDHNSDDIGQTESMTDEERAARFDSF